MSDSFQELDQKLRRILRDAYDIGDSEAETLLEVATTCMRSPGVLATAAMTGSTFGAVGGTVSIGTLTMPAWLAGALAGYVGGTAICVAHNFAAAKAIDDFLRRTRLSRNDLQNDVSTILRQQRSLKSTPHSATQRYGFLRSIGGLRST